MDEHDDVSTRARRLAEERYPNASVQKKAALANSVAALITGMSRGPGGPSVREHAARMLYGGRQYTFDEAVELLLDDSGPIFGPLTDVHRRCAQEEYCFDDDPEDLKELGSFVRIAEDVKQLLRDVIVECYRRLMAETGWTTEDAIQRFSSFAQRKYLNERAGEPCAADDFPPEQRSAFSSFQDCLTEVGALTRAQSDYEAVVTLLIAEATARARFRYLQWDE